MKVQEPALKMIPISYSSANLFEQCPARWKAEKIDKLQGDKPVHLLVGILLHEVTETYLKHLQKTAAAHDFALADTAFADGWAGRHSDIPEAMFEEISGVWESIKTELVLPQVDEMVDAEMKIALRADWTRTTWDAQDAWLRCKIDRLDADKSWHLRIWDLKTGWKIEGPEDSKQGKVYGAVVRRLFPQAEAITFELYYPRFKQRKEYTFAAKDFEEGERWITKIYERIQRAMAENRFRPTPNQLACAECPVFYSCSARRPNMTAQPPRTKDDAEKLLEQLMMVSREYDDVKTAIAGWIDNNGPIEVNGMVALNGLQQRVEFPIDQLEPILRKRGIDIIKAVKADNDKLEKLVRRDDALGKDLETIKVNKSTTQFKIKKAGV